MKKIFLTILFGLLLVFPHGAKAQNVDFAATKNLFDLEVFPGDSTTQEFAVFNQDKNTALPMHIELSLWNLKEDSDDIEFVTAEPALNATQWFDIEGGRDFILEPDASHKVRFTVSPPADVSPGSYFVMMRIQAVLPDHYYQEQGPRFAPEIGILTFVRVPILSLGEDIEYYSAAIEALDVKNKKPLPVLSSLMFTAEAGTFESMVEELTARIRNNGLFHFRANGTIEVKNMFGRTAAHAEIPEKFLLPNRSRNVDIQVVEGENFWQRNFRFGQYTATLNLNVPNSDKTIREELSFWIFPWKTLLAGTIILILLIAGHGRFRNAFLVLVRGEKTTGKE